jgi:hypothetical protein
MFRVYVNYPNNKAIVHRENCGCYKGIDKTHNGYWKHGFETAWQALKFARNTGKQIIDFCALCCRDLLMQNYTMGRIETVKKADALGISVKDLMR